ncbi:MAG: prepilin-type N-terminal cleavage/methylation domain-containing protein [Planctomycetaceae bacterium]|nr:prepilin-type N-terminal cleavage/methylation domain-containing protein [Planctomycetaceae bacterium]
MQRISTVHSKPGRAGFSLIELLMVIVIIAIIAGIAIPAIMTVMRRARQSEVGAEIARIETGIASFKGDFKIEPWSELMVTEDTSVTSWSATPELTLSKTRLRRLFPQFTFSGKIDFNGDGAFTGDGSGSATIVLTSSECLVFQLGGVMASRDADGDGNITQAELEAPPQMIGFSKNPLNPFSRAGSNRYASYVKFDPGRLVDLDKDGMPEYLDSVPDQATPYHFASSNNGQGYSKTQTIYVLADGKTPHQKDSHQLISPGADFNLGFDPAAGGRGIYVDGSELTGNRQYEFDNMANFTDMGVRMGD